jgi:predicted RNA binding protein YcfA (HicA-like mRNA interferase family)
MKIAELIKKIEKDGWFLVRQKGSHRQYKHPIKKGLVTLAFHSLGGELAIGTLQSVLKQAGLEQEKK